MTVYKQQTIRSGYCKPTPQERVHDRMFYRLVSHRLWEQHALPVWMLLLDVLLRSAQDNAWMKPPDPCRNHWIDLRESTSPWITPWNMSPNISPYWTKFHPDASKCRTICLRCPKIGVPWCTHGVPLNHPFWLDFPQENPSSYWGSPVEPRYGILAVQLVATTALAYPVATLSKDEGSEECDTNGPQNPQIWYSFILLYICFLYLYIIAWNVILERYT